MGWLTNPTQSRFHIFHSLIITFPSKAGTNRTFSLLPFINFLIETVTVVKSYEFVHYWAFYHEINFPLKFNLSFLLVWSRLNIDTYFLHNKVLRLHKSCRYLPNIVSSIHIVSIIQNSTICTIFVQHKKASMFMI